MTSTQNAPDTPTRTGPLAVVRRHPLLTFFLLANLLSWISWAPYVLSQSGLGVLPIHVDEDPLTCVVRGTGRILDDEEKYASVLES